MLSTTITAYFRFCWADQKAQKQEIAKQQLPFSLKIGKHFGQMQDVLQRFLVHSTTYGLEKRERFV